MKPEYNFSKGERGKFHRPNATFQIPVYLEPEVLRSWRPKRKRRASTSTESSTIFSSATSGSSRRRDRIRTGSGGQFNFDLANLRGRRRVAMNCLPIEPDCFARTRLNFFHGRSGNQDGRKFRNVGAVACRVAFNHQRVLASHCLVSSIPVCLKTSPYVPRRTSSPGWPATTVTRPSECRKIRWLPFVRMCLHPLVSSSRMSLRTFRGTQS